MVLGSSLKLCHPAYLEQCFYESPQMLTSWLLLIDSRFYKTLFPKKNQKMQHIFQINLRFVKVCSSRFLRGQGVGGTPWYCCKVCVFCLRLSKERDLGSMLHNAFAPAFVGFINAEPSNSTQLRYLTPLNCLLQPLGFAAGAGSFFFRKERHKKWWNTKQCAWVWPFRSSDVLGIPPAPCNLHA